MPKPIYGLPCCHTWENNKLIAETITMRAVHDGYPVTPGHALIYPKRHVDRFVNMWHQELEDLRNLVQRITAINAYEIDSYTIAINDGPLAGRTIPHLHIHIIPRREGDIPDPRGGVRRLLIKPGEQDPWIEAHQPA